MTKLDKHSFKYRVWNQSRLAKHVDDYLQVYEEIENHNNFTQPIPGDIFSPIRILHRTAYQSIIVHLDMIDAGQGVSLRKLIVEAESSGKIDHLLAKNLRDKLDIHRNVLGNIKRQRNNLVAHRSETQTFREVREAFPVSTADLRAVTETYHEITAALWHADPFSRIWARADCRLQTHAMLKRLSTVGDT